MTENFKFINKIPKKKKKIRQYREKATLITKRRETRKILNDVKYLCKFIERRAIVKGFNIEDRTRGNIDRIFDTVSENLQILNKKSTTMK